jgi:hypothetical protein
MARAANFSRARNLDRALCAIYEMNDLGHD